MKLPVKIPFEGFYNSTHAALLENWLEYEQETLQSEHGATLEQVQKLTEKFYSCINWNAVHVAYARAYCSEVEKLIAGTSGKLAQPFKLQLEFIELKSPCFYNYETDCIYANIPLEQLEAMRELILNEAHDEWLDYVKEKCTSYDGFISFYSNNYGTWEESLKEWGEARLGMLLEFYIMHILKDEKISDINEALSGFSLMADYDSNGSLSNSLWQHASEEFVEFYNNLIKD